MIPVSRTSMTLPSPRLMNLDICNIYLPVIAGDIPVNGSMLFSRSNNEIHTFPSHILRTFHYHLGMTNGPHIRYLQLLPVFLRTSFTRWLSAIRVEREAESLIINDRKCTSSTANYKNP